MRLPAAVQHRTSRWWPDTPEATDGRFTLLAVAALSLPVLGRWAPFFGFLVSLALALYAVSLAGDRAWGPRRGRRRGVALLGFAAMWLPAVIAFSGVLYPTLGESDSFRLGSTAWLLLPLCGPEHILLPTLAATVVYTAGAVVSGLLRRPWPWVLGALLSALSYDTVMYVRSIDTVC